MSYERVKQNWKDGLLSIAGLKQYYRAGVITKAQYKEIKDLPQKGQE